MKRSNVSVIFLPLGLEVAYNGLSINGMHFHPIKVCKTNSMTAAPHAKTCWNHTIVDALEPLLLQKMHKLKSTHVQGSNNLLDVSDQNNQEKLQSHQVYPLLWPQKASNRYGIKKIRAMYWRHKYGEAPINCVQYHFVLLLRVFQSYHQRQFL